MNIFSPTAYPELNNVLQRLTSSQKAVLEADRLGIYLQGSFAVGDLISTAM